MKNIPYRAPRTTTDLISIVEAEFPNEKTDCPHCNQPWKTGAYYSIMRFKEHMQICQKRTKASKEKSDAIELEIQRKRDTRAGRYSLLRAGK